MPAADLLGDTHACGMSTNSIGEWLGYHKHNQSGAVTYRGSDLLLIHCIQSTSLTCCVLCAKASVVN
eukprot:2117377-Amphidinium_carterae.1